MTTEVPPSPQPQAVPNTHQLFHSSNFRCLGLPFKWDQKYQ